MDKDIFKALGDPLRREILEILVKSPKGESLSELANKVNFSRQAATRHITTLEKAGLIKIEKKGREQLCSAELKNLEPAMNWMNKFYNMWKYKLDALEQYLDNK